MQMAVRQEDAVLNDTLDCSLSSSALQGYRAENQGGSSSSRHFLYQQTAQNRGLHQKSSQETTGKAEFTEAGR